MRYLMLLIVVILTSGCRTSGYYSFYQPYDDLTLESVEVLKKGDKPKVYKSNANDRDVYALLSKNYAILGVSLFNGPIEDSYQVERQAKRIGATVALFTSSYQGTETSTYAMYIPNSSSSGGLIAPISKIQRRYEQGAIFFAKKKAKPKIGIGYEDLSDKQKTEIEKNTGVVVTYVVEDAPAFKVNILPGDIILEVDGVTVKNSEYLQLLWSDNYFNVAKKAATIKLFRNKVEKMITITFDKN